MTSITTKRRQICNPNSKTDFRKLVFLPHPGVKTTRIKFDICRHVGVRGRSGTLNSFSLLSEPLILV